MTGAIAARAGIVLLATGMIAASCSGSEGTEEAFCTQVMEMATIDEQLAGIDLSNGDAVIAALTSFRDEFVDLAESSPAEVRDEAESVSRYAIALANAALSADPDDPFDRAAVLSSAAASEPGVDVALERLATYVSRNCTAAPSP